MLACDWLNLNFLAGNSFVAGVVLGLEDELVQDNVDQGHDGGQLGHPLHAPVGAMFFSLGKNTQ